MLENRMYNVFSLKLDLYISHNVCTSPYHYILHVKVWQHTKSGIPVYQTCLNLSKQGGESLLKSAVSVTFLDTKQQKTFRGTLVTQDHTSIGSKTSLGHSMDPKMDLIIFEKISGFLRKFWLFLFLIFDIVPLILPLSNSTNAQWTSWTFRDPRMDPQMNPARKFPGPLVNKVLAGSNHSLNWSILLDRSKENGQTSVYRLVWGPVMK